MSVAKGIEPGTCLRMSEIVGAETGRVTAALSGPTHAEEVSCYLPTGCVAASGDCNTAEFVQDAFMNEVFRVYTSPDVTGIELGGALKNIIALCAGISDGLGFEDNTKALLMTRGLAEVARLGLRFGAARETFAGLSGVGDLIVTCTSMHSRNRRAGILIGQGASAKAAMDKVGAVVEGYYATESAKQLGEKAELTCPLYPPPMMFFITVRTLGPLSAGSWPGKNGTSWNIPAGKTKKRRLFACVFIFPLQRRRERICCFGRAPTA